MAILDCAKKKFDSLKLNSNTFLQVIEARTSGKSKDQIINREVMQVAKI